MEHQDKKLEIWREAIPRMNEEDLEFILDFPECFEPKVLRMVKRRYDKITKPEDGEDEYEKVEETLKYAVLRILREMKCSYDFDEDGDIHFEYQDEDFYITVDDNNQFIEIWNCGWKRVNLNDTPNRKGYLEYLLDRFFFAHQFVEYKMQQLYEEDHPNERVN